MGDGEWCPAAGGPFPCVVMPDTEACWKCGAPAGEHKWRGPTWFEEGCPCSSCGRKGASERYSLGIYAGRYCGPCWKASGYRKEPASAFDPLDAGERYDDDY